MAAEFFMKRPESYLWPVTYRMPDETGKLHAFEFKARFRYLDLDQIKEQAEAGTKDADFIRHVLVGFEGIRSPDGAAVPDTPDHIEQLLKLPGMFLALQAAHTDALLKFARKN